MFIVVRLSQRQNAPLLMALSVEGSDTSFTAKQMAKQSSPSPSGDVELLQQGATGEGI